VHQQKSQEIVSVTSPAQPTLMANLTGLKKDGSEFYAELSTSFWVSPSGPCVTAIVRDITDRRIAEIKLLESEERFRNLAESATDAIILVNSAGEIIFWNNSATFIFNYSKDEAIGMPLKNIVGVFDAHQQAIFNLHNRDHFSSSHKYFESHGIRRDGQLLPVELYVSFWKSQDGGLYSAIIRDITQRKLTEESLQKSELQYRSVVETSSDAL
jgi:PAS domain S-box-containing protein